MSELAEPSDVSSDDLSDLSSFEEDFSKPRAAPHVDLLDLPALDDRTVTYAERTPPDLTEFWQSHPVPSLDALSEPQLRDAMAWAEDVHARLTRVVAELEATLQLEWAEKEAVLDSLLEKTLANPPLLD